MSRLCVPLRAALIAGAAVTVSGCASRGSLVFDCPDLRPRPVAVTGLDAALNCDAPGRPACRLGDVLESQTAAPADFADDLANAIAAAPQSLDAAQRAPRTPESQARGHTDVLLLSGGGQWGAYGAGLLSRLNERGPAHPDNPIDRVAAVTSISTGTMQALYVAGHHGGFTDAFPELLKRYQPSRESEIVDRDWAGLALIKGSIAGLKPLQRMVEAALDETSAAAGGGRVSLLEAIARSPVPSYAGFVDFGANQLMTVDMRRLAAMKDNDGRASGRTARACITAVALASSAIPMRFQQIRIRHLDGGATVDRTYVDGGVNRGVFLARIADGMKRGSAMRVKPTQGAPLDPGAPPTLYVLRNGPTHVEVESRRQKLDGRSYGAVTAVEETISAMVNRMEQDAIVGLRIDLPNGPVRFTTANGYDRFVWTEDSRPPQTGCQRKTDGTMFDPDFMRCLIAYGKATAIRGPWRDLPAAGSSTK
jgi:predicted acylesterase/phospholipase RssA